jgi:hypothetical protein
MRMLDQVRALFPVDAIVEVVEHTGRPDFKGQRRRVLKAQKQTLRVEILSGPSAGKRDYWMSLPTRAGDVRDLTNDQVSFLMSTGESLTVRVVSADQATADEAAAYARHAAARAAA